MSWTQYFSDLLQNAEPVFVFITLLGLIYFWLLNRKLRQQIKARKIAETEMQQLGDVLEHSLNEIYIFDANSLYFIQVNEGARNNLGYSIQELRNMTPLDIKPEYTAEKFKYLTDLLRSGLGQVIFETLHKRKNGSLYPVEVNLQLHSDLLRPVFYAVINDMSERKSSDAQIQRLSYLYETLSEINQAVSQIDNEADLFAAICIITIDFSHLELVWIGVENNQQQIVPVAYAGQHWGYLQDLLVSTDPTLLEGQGPSGRAFRSGEIQISNNFAHDDTTLPWHQKAGKQWASSCAIPILRGGKTYAVLNLYTSEIDYFGEESLKLFHQLQGDLSYALDAFDRENARRQTEDELKLAARVFQQSHDAIVICDNENKIISINKAFSEITGYSDSDVVGHNPKVLASGRYNNEFYRQMWRDIDNDGIWQGEIWNRHKNGELFLEWMTISVVKDVNEKVSHYIGIFSDITLRRESEQRVEFLAHFDALTKLPNRVLLKVRFDQEVASAERKEKSFALLYLDLDYFKEINDGYGHAVGDQLLVEVGKRLKSVLRNEDTVARLGGDEFNVLLPETDEAGAALVAQKISDVVAAPVKIDSWTLIITVSTGISLFPVNGKDYGTLAHNADFALYQSKNQGRNQYAFFTEAMQQKAQRRMGLETALHHALEQQHLQLLFQPVVDVATCTITGAEVLLCWSDPEWGEISPEEFIPLAEQCGLMPVIGWWVFSQSIQQAAEWERLNNNHLYIAINLSLVQFEESGIVDELLALLGKYQLKPEQLELELSESELMKNAQQSVETSHRLQQIGVKLSVDGFGSGYSSLSHLHQLKIHRLKVDRALVGNIIEDSDSIKVIDSIISLARNLQLQCTVEGVETMQQFQIVSGMQCDEVQGYLFSDPVPAAEFKKLLVEGFAANKPFTPVSGEG